jgi:hypothetical protein
LGRAATTQGAVRSDSFLRDSSGNTQPWNLSFREGSTSGLNLAAGSTLYLHTTATAAATTTGWGAVSGAGIKSYAIFTQRGAGRQDQEGTAPAAPGASRFEVPFDQTNGASVGVALANVASSTLSVWAAVQTTDGSTPWKLFYIPAHGHLSFALGDPNSPLGSAIAAAVSGKSGLAEFCIDSPSTPSLSVTTLRFNQSLSFTAAPVFAESGAPLIKSAGVFNGSRFSSLHVDADWPASPNTSKLGVRIYGDDSEYFAEIFQMPDVFNTQTFFWTVLPGTRSGQTFTFQSLDGYSHGSYGLSAIVSGSMTLTVNSFSQVGSSVTGNLSIATASAVFNGPFTGVSTYLPW